MHGSLGFKGIVNLMKCDSTHRLVPLEILLSVDPMLVPVLRVLLKIIKIELPNKTLEARVAEIFREHFTLESLRVLNLLK